VEELIFQDIGQYKGYQFQNIEQMGGNVPEELRKAEIVIEREGLPKQDEENFSLWI
jgi:hypothetical protein